MSSYLQKSRHGIWYFRVRLPTSAGQPATTARRPAGIQKAEFRQSLKTKDKKRAQYLALKKWVAMKDKFAYPQPWEVEADIETEKYYLGKALIAKHHGLDPNNRFALDEISERLTQEQFRAYIFAWEYDEEVADQKRARYNQSESPRHNHSQEQSQGTETIR
jgi:hypothetical protein